MSTTEQVTTISEQFEAACDEAARRYAAALDTTEIDAEVERLLALLDAA